MKVKQYKIVEGADRVLLAFEVNTLINQGWQPQGGVSMVKTDRHTWWYTQAMVKDS